LGAVRRNQTGAEEAWSLPLDSRLTTNLAAVENADGSMTLALGVEDGTLLIWAP
jgi:hypothetical protein